MLIIKEKTTFHNPLGGILMIGVYFTYESHILNSQGYIYNKASQEFEPRFRVRGLRSPTRSARQTSGGKVAKKSDGKTI
jgi:hypothetical protein